jgi:transcriptional regulator GlxA family with amidase domain
MPPAPPRDHPDRTTPDLDAAGPRSFSDLRVERAVTMIVERYGREGLTVRSCATEIGMTCEHLCRLFKRHTGQTFGAMLAAVRLREALHLVQYSTLSCKEIAARVGYRSTNQLDRQFKKRLGLSPTAVRRCGRGDEAGRFNVG